MFTSFTGTQRPIFVDMMYKTIAPEVRYTTNSKSVSKLYNTDYESIAPDHILHFLEISSDPIMLD